MHNLQACSFVSGFIKSHDHTPLFYRYYEADTPKASVIVVHGFAEHSGRYAHIIDRLVKEHFSVLCIDLRGHGYSKGRRGDLESFVHYEEDVKAAINFIQHKQPPMAKLFIIAHSMGALICLRLMAKMNNTIDGFVLSSPLLSLKRSMLTAKRFAMNILSKLWPLFPLQSQIKGKELTTDKHLAHNYDNDVLVLRKVSARAIHNIIKGYEEAYTIAPLIKHPFLMQVAGEDSIVDIKATKEFFSRVHNKDATIKYYPEFLHEIYNESRKNEAINDFMAWLNKRV
jgi:lysophospholipase